MIWKWMKIIFIFGEQINDEDKENARRLTMDKETIRKEKEDDIGKKIMQNER